MASAAKSSTTTLTQTLSVRLERDPAVESLLPAAAATPQSSDHQQVGDKKSDCFICGRSGRRNSEDLQQHREEKEYFKRILINPQVRSRMSSKAYLEFQNNFTTCITCLAVIEKVWALHKKMAAMQLDMDELMEDARQKTVETISKDKVQKAASSTSSIPIPVKQEITPRTVKEPKNSDRKVVPKIEAEDADAAADPNNGIKKEEDLKDVKLKKEEVESEDDEEVGETEHCKNTINIREQILSRRLTLRSLINVRRCGGRKKNVKKPGNKIRCKTVPTNTSKSRKAKSKTKISNSGTAKKIKKQLNCSKCRKLFCSVSRRLQHEIQVCKVHYDTMELEQWKEFIHKCPICGHFSGSNADLKRHVQSHKKPFSCPRCQKGFMHDCYMKTHFENNQCFPPATTMTVQSDTK